MLSLSSSVFAEIARLQWRLVALTCWALVGCRNASGSESRTVEEDRLELRYMSAPGNVSPIELAEDLGYLAPLKLQFVSSTTSGPQSIQAVVTDDVDVGSAFNGAVLKLIAAGAPIRAVVGSYGVDHDIWGGYYVLEDSPIHGARDLIGKKVAVNTLGAHQEFALKEYLQRHGLSQEEIRQVMLVSLPPLNVEQALRQRQVDVSVLNSIYRDVAVERGGLRPLFSDLELFGSFTAGTYVMKTNFIARHPQAARRFVEGVGKALDWSRDTPREQVQQRFADIIARRKRNENAALIKYWRSYGVAGRHGRIEPKDFQIWIDWMVRSGELRPGQVSASNVFTNELNVRP